VIARALVIVCVLASLASAKPRKAKKPKKAPKPAATEPTPAPVPAPAPAPEPAPVAVVAPPAVVAPAGKPRVAVIGDPDVARPFAKAIAGDVELVPTDDGAPRALAARHDLHAVIVVSAPGGSRGLAIVYQGSDGSELGRVETKAGRFVAGKRLGPEVIAKLGDKLAHATAPAPGTAVAAVEPARASSSASASANGVTASAPRHERAQRTLVISAEERPFWRRLRYNDDLDERLRPSDLVANAVALGASWRPLKNLRNFSVVGRGELAVGVNGSRTPDGTEYATSSSEWSLGAGFDIRIAAARVGIVAMYGEHRFALGDDPAMELVPDVTYRYVRGGLVVAAPLAPKWDLTFTAGWRQLLGLGGMTEASWFPRATGAGIDGSAGIAFHVTPWLDVQARLDLRRYFFAMHPEPGDPWIAGGATDQYFGGALGLAVSPR
jgi:hypothetical protein